MHFGLVEAVWFLWDCLSASGGLSVSSQHLIENGVLEAQDGLVVVVWPFPSSLVSGNIK